MSRRVASRSNRSRSSEPTEIAPDEDGKVLAGCPRCGEELRIAENLLEEKIECPSCHRTFFPKSTAGKRAKPPDHTKTYFLFGAAVVVIIGSFIAISKLGSKPPAKPVESAAQKQPQYSRTTHPRAGQVLKWAQAIRNDNQLVFETHTDMLAAARMFGVPASNKAAITAAVATHRTTALLRDMEVQRAALTSDDAMTAATGKGIVMLTPRPGTDDFASNTQAEIEVVFRMDGDQIKVTDWHVVTEPKRNALKGSK